MTACFLSWMSRSSRACERLQTNFYALVDTAVGVPPFIPRFDNKLCQVVARLIDAKTTATATSHASIRSCLLRAPFARVWRVTHVLGTRGLRKKLWLGRRVPKPR